MRYRKDKDDIYFDHLEPGGEADVGWRTVVVVVLMIGTLSFLLVGVLWLLWEIF